MHPALLTALDRALGGDAEALSGFGVEKVALVHPHWEDRLAVDAKGIATLSVRRPAADTGGEAIGLFRAPLGGDRFKAVLLALKQILSGPPIRGGRAEPQEPRLVLTVLAGGEVWEHVTGTRPGMLDALDPLLLPLTQGEMAAFQKPVRAAQARVLAARRLAGGGRRGVAVQLELVNPGAEGVWIRHPHHARGEGGDRVELSYIEVPKATPGVSPIPQSPKRAPLRPPEGTGSPQYLWLAPKQPVQLALEAEVGIPEGDWVCGVDLHLTGGQDTLAGEPRLRGSLFTKDAQVA